MTQVCRELILVYVLFILIRSTLGLGNTQSAAIECGHYISAGCLWHWRLRVDRQ